MNQTGKGLSEKEVYNKRQNGLGNEFVNSNTVTLWKIVKKNLFTYFNFIFFLLAFLLSIVHAWKEMFFLVVIICNIVIGILQEWHSKKILDKLSVMENAKIKVIRDGVEKEVEAEELVLGDLIHLKAGECIPADGRCVSGKAKVNESLVTGEADEIEKEERDLLLSGSFLTAGELQAELVAVGKNSYISSLKLEATKHKTKEQSKMIQELNRMIFIFGCFVVPIGVALFVQAYYVHKLPFYDSITGMVAAVIGMIPEGLYLLTTVSLASSTIRMAKDKVLIHDMRCIEGLARIDVLCVDKTGTITEPGMTVEGYRDLSDDNSYNKLCDFVNQMPPENETMQALKAYFKGESKGKADKITLFSSESKTSSIVFGEEEYILGAPEFVMDALEEEIKKIIDEYFNKGFRVLLFVKKYQQTKKPIALVWMSHIIRKGAKETFSFFDRAEVAIKVISGDAPQTVSSVALQAGIANAERYIDASNLITQADYERAAKEMTVFGRTTPEQKQKIIETLKSLGHTVAMTGDGVNDVLALKMADCSIAIATENDAASSVAQMVLLDGDFSKMPHIVREGQRVVCNIERTAALYIVKNMFSILLSIFSVLFMFEYPFEPTQITLVSLFTIGIPSVFLALEKTDKKICGDFLWNIFKRAIPAAVTSFFIVSGLVLFCEEFEIEGVCLSTASTFLFALVGFVVLYQVAKPMNFFHFLLLVFMILGFLICTFTMKEFFSMAKVSKKCLWGMFLFALAIESIYRYLQILIAWINSIILARKCVR